MKKVILILSAIFLLSFKTGTEKTLKFEFTESQVNMLWSTLEFCKGSIQTSQSPANDVKNITKIIDSLQNVIRVQYIAQLKDSIKK